jgi:ParB-like chromosome segregation protein Spo0J
MKLKLKDIRIDGGTQPRKYINQETVAEYAENMLEDAQFPPMTVFNDGVNFWLADGFHRFHANKKAGFLDVECDVRTGTLREAVLFSLSANSRHGLRRTNEDKRNAVMKMLNDVEWSEWSDQEIARHCDVSPMTVGRIRKTMGLEKTEKKYERNGIEKKMDVTKLSSEPVVMKPSEVMIEEDKLAEMAAAVADMSIENEKLMHQLAVQQMPGTEEEKAQAAETLESQRQLIHTLEAEIRALKVSRDGFQAENAELKRQVKYWRGKYEKMEKAAA